MPGLELDAAIGDVLRQFRDISAAWLFGSEARGEAQPGSDLDIALLFRERGTTARDVYQLLGTLAAQLEGVAPGRRIDLVLIEQQGPIFQHQVLSQGRLVYDADRRRRVDFESDMAVRYFDFAPLYARARRHAAAGFKSWVETQR